MSNCMDNYTLTEQAYKNGYEAGKPKWISVEERLPEVLDLYLVVVKQKYSWEKTYRISTDCASYQPFGADGYIDGCWDTCNDWDEGEDYIHITHWMPIPEPPEN